MDLAELLDENELQQDEWSLTAPKFGAGGQLEVIGWSGKSGNNKLYILKCNKCSLDRELFGEGYFRNVKGSLLKGKTPCGCSKAPKWTKEQYFLMCKRKADELGYKFLGFVSGCQGQTTKIKMLCEKHGEWSTTNINNLMSKGSGCPICKTEVVNRDNTKPDDVMITTFLSSGAFHPETKFWRSERKTKAGVKAYWFMFCPECGETGESFSGSLQKGQRPCLCSPHRQTECYINWLIDDHNMAIAIKFGIANSSKQRIKDQNRLSSYTLEQHSVYQFPDVASCKKAERECLQELECGVILKRDFPDGYTETTWAYNLEKIIEIYERNGGVEIEKTTNT